MIGIVGPIYLWVAVFTVGYVTGNDLAQGSISAMAFIGEPYAEFVRAGLVLLSASIAAFAFALDRMYRESGRPWIGTLLLMVVGITGIVGSIWPKGGLQMQILVNIHLIFGLLGVFVPIIGVPLVAWRLHKDERWPGYRSVWTFVIVTILVVGSFALWFTPKLFIGDGYPYSGLTQIAFNGIMSGWIAYHSFKLYRLTLKQ